MTYALLLQALSHDSEDVPQNRDTSTGERDHETAQGHDSVDQALVTRLRNSDTTALEALMRRYADPMGRLATHLLGSRDTAEDVVQEIFVRIWRRRDTLDAHRSLRSLLLTAVRRRALNMREQEKVRERYRMTASTREIHTSLDIDATTPRAALDADVDLLIAALPERQQTAIRLRYVEQLTVPEIAHVLAMSPNATHQLIFRALATLRRRLKIRP